MVPALIGGRVSHLLSLRLAVARGRWRRAMRRRSGPLGPAIEVLVVSGSVVLLIAAAAAFTVVGMVVVSSVARRGEMSLAAAAVAAASLIGLALAALTTIVSQVSGANLDDGPLAALPIRAADRIGAELVGLLTFEPTAAVILPTAAIPLLAAAQGGPVAAMLTVPAASGQAVLAAALALLTRRVASHPHAARPALWVMLGSMLALATMASLPRAGGVWTPWSWSGRAFVEAWNNSPAALAWGLLPHLLAFGLLALARTGPELIAAIPRLLSWGRAGHPRQPRPARASTEGLRRCWGPARARALLGHCWVAGLGVLALGWTIAERTTTGFPTLTLASFVACWILAAGPAPLLANTLGLGGPAGASALLADRRAGRSMAIDHLRLSWPGLAGSLLAAATLAHERPGPAWLLPAAVGVGMVAALSGAGALASTLWPWPAALAHLGDPLWNPVGARSLMALCQGIVVTPASLACWYGCATNTSVAFVTLILGFGLFAVGWAAAAARLRRFRQRVLEGLLS